MANEISHAITAALNTVVSWTVTGQPQEARVTNRTGAGEVWITTDGTTPVVGADNQYFLPAVLGAQILLGFPEPPGAELQHALVIQAISSAALSIEVEV